METPKALDPAERRIVGEVPCRACGKQTGLTAWAEKLWAWANGRLKLSGQPLLRSDEVAECGTCQGRAHLGVCSAARSSVLQFGRYNTSRDAGRQGGD